MQIIIALLVFTVIIVIHELGHFLLAKKNGVTVTEFSVGMGPRLITVVKTDHGFSCKIFASSDMCFNREDWKDHTKYSWKIFPIGGSCMMLGEDEDIQDENAFNNKSVWARISVIFAGPLFNFILAFAFAMIIIGKVGYDKPIVNVVAENFYTEGEGIQVGDVIESINGTKIHISREVGIYQTLEGLSGDSFEATVLRDGKSISVTSPYYTNAEGAKGFPFDVTYARTKVGPWGVIKYGAYEVKFWIETTIKSLGEMIQGKVSKDDISGPVGIVSMIGDTYTESKSAGLFAVILNMLNISILLSANLGVMNLLPLPALDGGRLVFLFIEAIRGKAIDREKEGMVHLIGIVALMLLMVFVMFNDISRLFG